MAFTEVPSSVPPPTAVPLSGSAVPDGMEDCRQRAALVASILWQPFGSIGSTAAKFCATPARSISVSWKAAGGMVTLLAW
ncbi:MAG: hypothetical protein ACK55E_02940 [Cyanobacteriota bacterium]